MGALEKGKLIYDDLLEQTRREYDAEFDLCLRFKTSEERVASAKKLNDYWKQMKLYQSQLKSLRELMGYTNSFRNNAQLNQPEEQA